MALDQSALLELLERLKAADADDVVRQAVESVFQALIDAEATARIGAAPHERTQTRLTQRNGYRDRLVTTAAGDVELRIPKLRAGSFFPSLLERRRRIDQALFAVVIDGLRARGFHPQGRRPSNRAGRRLRDLQERGLPSVRRPRC
jgi:putative transposase